MHSVEQEYCIKKFRQAGIFAQLNPKGNTPIFGTNVNPLQLYHSPRAKILAFKQEQLCKFHVCHSVSNLGCISLLLPRSLRLLGSFE